MNFKSYHFDTPAWLSAIESLKTSTSSFNVKCWSNLLGLSSLLWLINISPSVGEIYGPLGLMANVEKHWFATQWLWKVTSNTSFSMSSIFIISGVLHLIFIFKKKRLLRQLVFGSVI